MPVKDPFNAIFDNEYRLFCINSKMKCGEYKHTHRIYCPVCKIDMSYVSMEYHQIAKRHQRGLVIWQKNEEEK